MIPRLLYILIFGTSLPVEWAIGSQSPVYAGDTNKNKNIKNVTRCRDSRSAKSIEILKVGMIA